MAKQKLSSNPADAFRKAQRARELKKNKEHRKKSRETQTLKRDTRDLESEIKNIKSNPKPSPYDKTRLGELETELAYIIKTKESYVKEHPEARDRIFKVHAPRGSGRGDEEEDGSGGQQSHLYDDQGRLRDPTRSIYYDKVYNPFGVPPPGMPYRERTPDDSEEEEDEDDENEDSDDEIIMPEGPAPPRDQDDGDEDSDDSDDIPLPPGPPPPRALPASIPPPPRPPIYMTGSSGPSSKPYAPPLSGHGPRTQPGPARALSAIQDPLSDGPTSTYQGYQMGKANLPPRPATQDSAGNPPNSLPPRPSNESGMPKKPLTEGAGTISAEPQLRDLRKEATAFVPRGVKRKAAASTGKLGGGGVKVNAAPGSGVVDEDGDQLRIQASHSTNGNGLMGVLKGVLSTSADAQNPRDGKVDDDYEKFLEGLGDLV